VKVAFAIALAAGIAAAAPGTRDRIPPGLDDFANSAALPYGLLTVNVDITENDGPTLPGEASVFVSLNAQATWTETLLTEMPGEPGGTWESASSIADGDVFYYFIVRDDSSAAMSAPLNALDAFPPPANLLADPRDEPAGDANAPNSQAVDLTGAAFGYSDTHFYATLSNATGTWPFSGGLFGPWYVYSALVDNPDAGEDSLALALVYANVPLIASSGLYAVDARDSTYARVGDIDCAVQGGKLHMRAALEDLYAQPAFGASNPSGKFHVGAGTATSLITTYRFENDRTHPYALYHRTDVARVGANEPPSLSDGGWEPAAQTGRDTPVRFFVTYTDPDGNLPVTRSVVVDGVPREMISATPVHDYAAGVTFECETSLPPGEHAFRFAFSDGIAAVETAPEAALVPSGVPENGAAVALHLGSPQAAADGVEMNCSLDGAEQGIIRIRDAAGRLVRTLAVPEGAARWDGRDASGSRVASGVYFVSLSCAAGADRARIVIVR
jgi:hypothetical protein